MYKLENTMITTQSLEMEMYMMGDELALVLWLILHHLDTERKGKPHSATAQFHKIDSPAFVSSCLVAMQIIEKRIADCFFKLH